MSEESAVRPRRMFLTGALATPLFAVRGAFAAALTATAGTIEGPFYPDRMPLDTDNDLLIINESITPAVGQIAHLTGRVLTASGQPVRNAVVEIWQCDAKGSYIHSRGRREASVDTHFQGYGRFLTASNGGYSFRTIKPVPYELYGIARAPHIHLAVSRNGRRLLTTQIHVRGHAANVTDGVLRGLAPDARETVLADFRAVPSSTVGELAAAFDVVLGATAEEGDDGVIRGGIGKSIGTRFWDIVKPPPR
jgi:protocatechuate 3,4-dioxygenase, beta subunit